MSTATATTCLLCYAALAPSLVPGVLLHRASEDCDVRLTDALGVCADEDYELAEDGQVYAVSEAAVARSAPPDEAFLADVQHLLHVPVDVALARVFDKARTPRLGGASSDLGWSSFSVFMRCPYLWKRRYLTQCQKPLLTDEPLALAVGSLVHTYLAVTFMRMIDATYPLTADAVSKALFTENVDPVAHAEAWRVYAGYRSYYKHDVIRPLAVEYRLVDPRTGLSCRYDTIVELPETDARPGGTYVMEHKTSARFDDSTLTGWVNDGEVIGQIMLWKQLSLDKRFGPLQGVIVNIIGKQKKEQLFHRTFVGVQRWQVQQHERDLQQFHALRQLYTTHDSFPRARANCVSRYGKCDQWEHCATGEG